MGFNHAAAFAPTLQRPKFFPPFEGPVVGFTPKPATAWRSRRADWIQCFLFRIRELDTVCNLQDAVDWVMPRLPETIEALDAIFTPGNIEKEVKLFLAYSKG